MTNPNCEYSLNIPAIVTLADWVHNKDWDATGMSSHKKAVKAMLSETFRESYGKPLKADEIYEKTAEDDLSEEDIDLICQMFWLPHSHGPKITKLLEDYKYCKENAVAVVGWKEFEPGLMICKTTQLILLFIFCLGEQPDVVDIWIEKASFVNKIFKDFYTVPCSLSVLII